MANVARRAYVVWEGDLRSGRGTLTEESSGALREAPITFASRVERSDGKTSPEELIASAHASCYAMALSHTLASKDVLPTRLEVNAVCTLDDEELKINAVDLDVRGEVPGMSNEKFQDASLEADRICPVSNALRGNVKIRVQARLSSQPG